MLTILSMIVGIVPWAYAFPLNSTAFFVACGVQALGAVALLIIGASDKWMEI